MTLSLSRRADLWGDRAALVDNGTNEAYSYEQLAELSRTAASRLAAWGVGPGDRVVVLSRNRVELVTLLFGARRRGATLAPISHRLAAGTATTLCDRIDPTLTITEPEFADRVTDRETVDFETFTGKAPVEDADGKSDAAPLFLHTGGTTGVPKVVPVSERQLEWNAITESVAWGLSDETVTISPLPLFHTGGWNLLMLPTLYSGGTVVLLEEFDPGEMLAAIEEYGATQLFAVAAIYRALADHPDFTETDFSTVEWCMSGGGPCPQGVMEPYRERGLTFTQGYGSTEAGPNNLYLSPERADTVAKSDRVGRPFPDCETRLVDSDGDVIEGEGTGELELAGPVTANGYLETADGTFGGDWVSTGDIAYRDEDGDYAIVGRTDNMFISGGENVFPEEIEDTLEAHEGVDAVGVTPIPHDKWGEVPKAVIVGEATADELEAYAREHLADYERPHEYQFVDGLPETGAGKLDRDVLDREYGA